MPAAAAACFAVATLSALAAADAHSRISRADRHADGVTALYAGVLSLSALLAAAAGLTLL